MTSKYTERYNKHKKDYAFRTKKNMRGFDDIAKKYSVGYDSIDDFHLDKEYPEYNKHNWNTLRPMRYWTHKDEDEYYSLNKFQRMKLKAKFMVWFFRPIRPIFLLILLIFPILGYKNAKNNLN